MDANGNALSGGERALTALGFAVPFIPGSVVRRLGNAIGGTLGTLGKTLKGVVQRLKPCFAAGTPVLMEFGSKPIEQIRPGDLVMSRPEGNPEAPARPARVVETFVSHANVVALTIGSETIRTTAEHPFWVRGRGWTEVKDLVVGDQLMSHDGGWTVLSAIADEQNLTTVYNFEVEGLHTYFIGESGWGFSVWTHNKAYSGEAAPKAIFGRRTAEEAGISEAQARRIQNAADRTGQQITVVGSRAKGTADPNSDWDYILSGKSSQRHSARSSLPRGIAGGEINSRGIETGIDIWQNYNPNAINYGPLRPRQPHVIFTPRR